MATKATAHYYTGTPTEMIVLKGETDKGREVEMRIPHRMAVEILTKFAEAYKQTGHVGHAGWHVKNANTDFEHCWSCNQAKNEDKPNEETTPDYWDCECTTDYIHHKSVPSCDKCGCDKEDQPDSRVSEVDAILKGL
jgi:hypothetical protein